MSTMYTRSRRPIVLDRPHDRHASELQDGLGAARGIVLGAALGTLMWAAMIAALLLLAGCGDLFEDEPKNSNMSTCYRCSLQGSSIVQTTYSCSSADAQQFGRPCLR